MLPRLLSVAAPLSVWITLIVLLTGMVRERKRWDWLAAAVAATALIASFLLVRAEHRLYFDEDIYTQIASNLAKTPAAQLTLLGSPTTIDISTYYKEPSGYPLLLSIPFLVTGVSEHVAFVLARLMYAATVGAVYLLGFAVLKQRKQAAVAALMFAAVPMSMWFSASSGTDLPATLFATLGILGIYSGNGALAAAGLAMAAQTRIEMIVLMPLLLLAKDIGRKWQIAGFALILVECLHIAWVLSIAPLLARAERVQSAFSLRFLASNTAANVKYLFNPLTFPALLAIAAILVFCRSRHKARWAPLALWGTLPAGVYVFFYAGSFAVNPRYSIQISAPIAIMAASVVSGPIGYGLAAATIALPYFRPIEETDFVRALREDHDFAVSFARRLSADDMVVTSEPEIFLNHGVAAMNAVFASEQKQKLMDQWGKYKRIWYYAGVRTSVEDSQQGEADRWMKSTFRLHFIDSREIRSRRISYYELLKPVDGNGG